MSAMKKLPNLVNVAASSTATLNIPRGPTYDAILIRASGSAGVTLATLTNIRLMLNGKAIMEFASAAELDSINQYHGRDAVGGTGALATPFDIMLHFRRPEVQAAGRFSTIDSERVTSLRTADLSTIAIEMTTGAWTAPVLEAFSVESPFPPEPVGLLTKVKRFTYNAGGAGDFVIADLPRGPRVIAMHVNKADANIVTVKQNSYAVIDAVSKAAIQDIQDQEGRVPVAGYTVIDFCHNGNLDEALRTADLTDWRTTLNLGSGGAFPVTVEYLDTFSGL